MLSHKMDFNCCANRDGFRKSSHICFCLTLSLYTINFNNNYTRYNICSAWFLDIVISTCLTWFSQIQNHKHVVISYMLLALTCLLLYSCVWDCRGYSRVHLHILKVALEHTLQTHYKLWEQFMSSLVSFLRDLIWFDLIYGTSRQLVTDVILC